MMRRWLGPRARASRVRVRQAAWGVVVVATVIILAWTGQEKLQSLATRWDLDPPTAMAGAHAEGAASTSLLMQASKPEDAAGAAGPTAMPGPVHERPMETPPFVAPSAPETEEAGRQDLDRNDGSGAVEQEAGGWDEDAEASAMDDDDSHELFAEELKVGDDDDEAVVVRPRSPAAPKTEGEQDLDRNDGSGEVDQEAGGREDASPVDDDDSHELFAEELREDDDDDEAVVVRPRSPAAPAAAATTTASSSSSSMTVSECVANYGTRHFLRDDQPTAPPILYSFPGSGNTWTRFLIDFATGVYSGTVFPREERSGGKLPGQGHCHKRVSVIKAHPQHFGPQQLFTLPENNTSLARCRHKGGIDTFDRFILLTRNPYDAIWSEYRRTTSTVFRRDDFDAAKFEAAALKMSNQYMDGIKDFRQVRRTLPKQNILNIQYEDMLDEDMRMSILKRLVDFVGLNDDATPKERNRRVMCAFGLAEDVGGGRRGSNIVKNIEEDDPNPIVTAADAFPRKLACAMWSVFGEAVKDTYTLPNGIPEDACK